MDVAPPRAIRVGRDGLAIRAASAARAPAGVGIAKGVADVRIRAAPVRIEALAVLARRHAAGVLVAPVGASKVRAPALGGLGGKAGWHADGVIGLGADCGDDLSAVRGEVRASKRGQCRQLRAVVVDLLARKRRVFITVVVVEGIAGSGGKLAVLFDLLEKSSRSLGPYASG